MESFQIKVGSGYGQTDGLGGVARFDGEAKLAVEDAGGGLFVGVGVDAGGDSQQHVLSRARGGGNFLQQSKLVEAIDDDAANVPLDGLFKLVGGLVAAVEVDQFLREVDGLGHGELAAGDHVQAQALLGEDLGDGGVHVCLTGVGDGGVWIALVE